MHIATTLMPGTVPVDSNIGYKLVRDLIFYQAQSFKESYGGMIDELISEANFAFVKAHNQFITGRSPTGKEITDSYATEISRSVWYRLFDSMRLKVRREHLAKMVSIEDEGVEGEMFNAFDLSKDARYVVALVLDPPDYIISSAELKGGECRNYRSAIRGFLKKNKWSATRIDCVFNEIKDIIR